MVLVKKKTFLSFLSKKDNIKVWFVILKSRVVSEDRSHLVEGYRLRSRPVRFIPLSLRRIWPNWSYLVLVSRNVFRRWKKSKTKKKKLVFLFLFLFLVSPTHGMIWIWFMIWFRFIRPIFLCILTPFDDWWKSQFFFAVSIQLLVNYD